MLNSAPPTSHRTHKSRSFFSHPTGVRNQLVISTLPPSPNYSCLLASLTRQKQKGLPAIRSNLCGQTSSHISSLARLICWISWINMRNNTYKQTKAEHKANTKRHQKTQVGKSTTDYTCKVVLLGSAYAIQSNAASARPGQASTGKRPSARQVNGGSFELQRRSQTLPITSVLYVFFVLSPIPSAHV